MYDVIVVGARCAGSPTAMLLARQGHNVLVLDRARFPSDTLSTHFIAVDGVGLLQEWGLYDRVVATGVPELRGVRRNMQGMVMPPGPDDPIGICPRRTVLDKILVDAAREAGAEVREAAIVEAVIIEDGRAVGVRGRTGDTPFEERAKIIVGADGRESFVARQVDAASYNEIEGTTTGYYTYFSGFDAANAELYLGGGRAMFAFPTNDGETCIAVEVHADSYPNFKADIENNVMAVLQTEPAMAERLPKATRNGKFMGMTPHKSFYRKPFGPGWALVGDAGYYRDPLLGQGINDAFRDAAALAAALHGVLSEGADWDTVMNGYEQQRNAATNMIYNLTALLCKDLNPSAELMQMMAAGPPPPVAAG
jgi:2-polyprenyl-6-methoxyphenol hydroxylase-like FAD-dependent oxidoreductase